VTLTLGIETSCDETSAAVVENGRVVHSNIVSSQIDVHAPFGGVVPEIASRQHIRSIVQVVETALAKAGISKAEVDQIAVTQGPGLAGALLVGLTFARGLALALGIPCIGVNHLDGHLHSVWLASQLPITPEPELPMLALIVSGGHTELVLVENHGRYRLVGRTLDDAAGEAFDKVARLLGLEYPGGPAIQRVAGLATRPSTLPRAWLPGTHDFSFSGLKTAVLHLVHAEVSGDSAKSIRGAKLPQLDVASGLTVEQQADIAAGFQESVVDVLVTKTARAASDFGVSSVGLVGGVAASRALREHMKRGIGVPLHIAPLEYCTDNGAMIASAGYYQPVAESPLDVRPSLQLVAVP
jgi:N6-L-threonylcarbamoyladenine synthase